MRRNKIYGMAATVAALGSCVLIPSQANAQESTANNTLYLEGGGPGGFYSINFERRISDFGLRVGFSYFQNSAFKVTAFPLGFNYIGVGGRNSHLELGATATVAFFEGTGLFTDGTNAMGVFGSGIIGYRYQPADGGFNFRIGAAPLLGGFGIQPWGYISFGVTLGGGSKSEVSSTSEYVPPPSSAPPQARSSAPAQEEPKPNIAPPRGIGGFEFQMSVEAARSSCEGSGNEFVDSNNISRCSGPAESVGVEGSVQLLKCGDEFCQLLLTAEPEETHLIADIKTLKGALTERYGAPAESNTLIPQECRNSFIACLDDHRAYLEYIWTFPSGEGIKLRLGDKNAKPKIEAEEAPKDAGPEEAPNAPPATDDEAASSKEVDTASIEGETAPPEEAPPKETRGVERTIRLLYTRPAPASSKKPAL